MPAALLSTSASPSDSVSPSPLSTPLSTISSSISSSVLASPAPAAAPPTALWQRAAARLAPFLARRLAPSEVDDVMQDVFLRIQRGLPTLRDEERFSAWLFQIARNAVAEHLRHRARHPLVAGDGPGPASDDGERGRGGDVREPDEAASLGLTGGAEDDDREASRALSACVSLFVARLPSPYREAVTLVELEGLPIREAAAMTGASLSAMKSRVQRGRAQLRALLEDCCEIALDARGKVTAFTPRCTCPARPRP